MPQEKPCQPEAGSASSQPNVGSASSQPEADRGPCVRYADSAIDTRPFDHNALEGIVLPEYFSLYFPVRFAKMTPYEREQALDHSLVISPHGEYCGWQDVHIFIDGSSIQCHISTAIGPNYQDFADAVAKMGPVEQLEFGWAQEPGSYRWCISRVCDVVFVDPPLSRTGFIPNVFMRWDAFLKAVNLDGHVEALSHEEQWWFDENARSYWNSASDDDLKYDLEDALDSDFDVARTSICTGWHDEPWEELIVVADDHIASYCDSGMDALVDAIVMLADGQDIIFRHGTQPGGPHDWFISRRRDWVLLDNPALGINWDTFSYEKVRSAFARA